MAEEFTAKFKVDISDLKKNISEASKQIKLANATFKSETAGMESWSKDADGLSSKLKQLGSNLSSQKSILSSYQEQLKKQQEAYTENGNRAEQLKAKLQELASQGVQKTDEEYQNYEKSLKNVLKEQQNNEKAVEDLTLTIKQQEGVVAQTEAAIDKYTTAQQQLEKESSSLLSTVEKQEKQLAELKKQYVDTAAAQGEGSDEAKELANQIKSLSGELAENKTKLSNAEKAADDLDATMDDLDDTTLNTSDGFTVMKGALANLVADGIRKAIDAIKDFAKETVNVGKEFDSSMSQVQAVSGATADDLEALRDKAKEMGSTTSFTASEAADAFNYMAMAGWKTEDMLEGIDGILNLAAASGSDLATTSDIVTDALTAMGYSAKDAGKLADVMAAASSNANTNVEMMGQTFQYAAPIVGALGYSMEDTAVAIGLMANAGIKGEKAGTALRSVLTRLSAPPKECADAMDDLGISLTDGNGNMKDLDDVIGDLRTAFSKLTETEKTHYAKSIAGQEAMSGLLAIVSAAPEDFNKLTTAVNDSNGAAEEMATTMLDNLGGDMTLLQSKLEGVQLAMYEKFEPALRKGVEALSGLLDVLSWIIDNGDTIVSVLETIGAGILAYSATTAVMKAVELGWEGIKNAIKATEIAQKALNVAQNANPVGLVIGGIAALAVAAKKLVDVQEEQIKKTYGLNEEEQKLIDSINEETEALNSAKEARDSANKAIESEFGYTQQLWDELQKIVTQNGRIKKGYEDRAAVITDILSEALGTEIKIVDGQIQKYDELKKSIDEVIATKKAEALLDANKQDYTTAIQNQASAYKKYQDEIKNAQKAQDELSEAQSKADMYQEQLNNGVTEAYEPLQNQLKIVKELQSKYDEEAQAVKDAESNYLNYANTIQNYEGLMAAIASGDADKLSASMVNLSNSFMTAENATKEMLENQLTSFQENYQAMKDAVAMGMPGVTQAMVDQAAELVERAKVEFEKVPDNFTDIMENLNALAAEKGLEIPASIASGIRSGAYAVPQSANELQALVTFDSLLQLAMETGVEVPENITKGIQDGSMKPQTAVATMSTLVNFDDIVKKATEAGINVPDYISRGVRDGNMKPQYAIIELQKLVTFENLKQKATEAGISVPDTITSGVNSGKMKPKEAIAEMQSLITFNDLLSKAKTAGIDVPDSLTTGINNGQLKPSEAISKLNELVIAAADNTVEMKSAGEDTVGGFIEGIRAKTEEGDTAAQDFIQSVIDAAKTAQDSHSPSKVWRDEIGKSAGEGFALGILDASDSANSAATQLVNNTLEIVKQALTSIVTATNQGGSQMVTTVTQTTNSIATVVSNASTKIKQLISNTTTNLSTQIGNIGSKIKSQVTQAINSVVSALQTGTNKITTTTQTSANKLKSIVTSTVNSIVSTLQTGINKINNLLSSITSSATSKISSLGAKIKSQVTTTVNSVVSALNSGKTKILSVISTLSSNITSQFTKLASQLKTQTSNIMDNLVSDFSDGGKKLKTATATIITNVVSAFTNSVDDFETAGGNMAQGVAAGFLAQEWSVRSQVNAMIARVVASAKANMKINSPSKVWAEIGDFMAQGLGVGFVNEMKVVNEDIQKSLPTEAANNLLGQLNGNGSKLANANGNVSNNKTMNFTQNIYAPQQPSRIELYRQTKNLLALAERGI